MTALKKYLVLNLFIYTTVAATAQGVRVTDIATWVGLKWSLNYGGIITRTVKDKLDEGDNSTLCLARRLWSIFG